MDRRSFLKSLSAGGILAGGTTACAALPYATATPSEEGVRVAVSEMDEREFALIDVSGQPAPVMLVRVDDGFAALSTRCTHRGCTVRPKNDQLECPCHGSRYTLEGELLEGPASRGLERFAVRQDDGMIIVHIPQS